jgi:DNA-binding MarR family transcriptional regulator
MAIATPSNFDPVNEARKQWQSRWPEAATAMATATSIMRAQQIVLRAVDGVLKPFGLTFARFEALVLLSFTRSGQLPLGKMGERLMIHPTSVTNIVDRLVGDDLVERIPHPKDRRTILAKITPLGLSLIADATKAVNEIQFGVEGLSEGDQETIIALIGELRKSVGDYATTSH